MNLFYSSSVLGAAAVSAADLEARDDSHHPNLIRLLQAATVLKVPVLPLTWDPAFEALGQDGATSRVNQSPLNAALEFAYKRFNPESNDIHTTQEAFRRMQYDAMIAELTILSCPNIRRHENIVSFIGICFEVSSAPDEVLPVIVFKKAEHGDLPLFLAGNLSLDASSLTAICGEVAKGIQIMHNCGIVHGDIKPTNILVEQSDDPEGVLIKVSDFGFSSYNSGTDDGVKVARTQPWEAPEWTHRYFTLENAKKMDIYTLGLLCLWVLFRHQPWDELGSPAVTVGEALASDDLDNLARIRALKMEEDAIMNSAVRMVQHLEDIDDELRIRLVKAFRLMLASNRSHRAETIDPLVELLGVPEANDRESSNVLNAITLPEWHAAFKIEEFFFHLDLSDFRIHSAIAESLKMTGSDAQCSSCQSNAAFQLAICFTFGFGVPRNYEQRDAWLEKSDRTLTDVQSMMSQIKKENSRANFIAGLNRMGHRSNLLDRYRKDGLLVEATRRYEEMTTWRQEAFGSSHYSVIRIKDVLVDLLTWSGRFEDALPLAQENFSNASEDVGLEERLALKGKVATILNQLGRLAEAGVLRREIARGYDNQPDNDYPGRLLDQVNLGDILLAQGKYDEALEIGLSVEKDALLRLGPYHATSLSAKNLIVEAYDAKGELKLSSEINQDLLRSRQQSSVPDHAVWIEGMSILGVQYYRLGALDMALKCHESVMVSIEKDKKAAIPAATAINNYAAQLVRRGQVGEGITILEHLLGQAKDLLGGENEETMAIMGNLAAGYQKQQRWKDAEQLEEDVLKFRRRTLGDHHRYTLSAFGNLSRNLTHQRRWSDVAILCKEELAIRDAMFSTNQSRTIQLVSHLATALTLAGSCAEALKQFSRYFQLIGSEKTDGPPENIPQVILVGMCHAKLGQSLETRHQTRVILSALARPWKAFPAVVVDHLTYLAKACDERRWDDLTEQVLAAAQLVVDMFEENMMTKVVETLDVLTETFLARTSKTDLVFDPSTIAIIETNDAMGGLSLEPTASE